MTQLTYNKLEVLASIDQVIPLRPFPTSRKMGPVFYLPDEDYWLREFGHQDPVASFGIVYGPLRITRDGVLWGIHADKGWTRFSRMEDGHIVHVAGRDQKNHLTYNAEQTDLFCPKDVRAFIAAMSNAQTLDESLASFRTEHVR